MDAARELARRYGFELRSAMNNDVNGFAWSLPQIFRQAGVRYFASGINETRSRAPLRRPNAFWWELPDGSRILHWNGEHYLFANYELALHEAVDRAPPRSASTWPSSRPAATIPKTSSPSTRGRGRPTIARPAASFPTGSGNGTPASSRRS